VGDVIIPAEARTVTRVTSTLSKYLIGCRNLVRTESYISIREFDARQVSLQWEGIESSVNVLCTGSVQIKQLGKHDQGGTRDRLPLRIPGESKYSPNHT